MKRFFVLLVLSIFNSGSTTAGGWTCHLVKVELTLEAKKVVGFVFLGDDFRGYLKKGVMSYLADYHKYPNDTIEVYDTVYTVKYPKFDRYKIAAVTKDDIFKVPVSTIKKIRVLSMGPCHEWIVKVDPTQYESYYAWVGHTMLTDLTRDEIQMLNSKPVAAKSFQAPLGEYSVFWMISYSQSDGDASLEMIFKEYKSRLSGYSGPLAEQSVFNHQEYQKLKQSLRKRRIIIFKIGYVA